MPQAPKTPFSLPSVVPFAELGLDEQLEIYLAVTSTPKQIGKVCSEIRLFQHVQIARSTPDPWLDGYSMQRRLYPELKATKRHSRESQRRSDGR